jgi:hypothetical protein
MDDAVFVARPKIELVVLIGVGFFFGNHDVIFVGHIVIYERADEMLI